MILINANRSTMKDVVGNDLYEGDTVVTMYNGYSSLIIAKVIGFSTEKIRLRFKYQSQEIQQLKFSNQVCKVIKQ